MVEKVLDNYGKGDDHNSQKRSWYFIKTRKQEDKEAKQEETTTFLPNSIFVGILSKQFWS